MTSPNRYTFFIFVFSSFSNTFRRTMSHAQNQTLQQQQKMNIRNYRDWYLMFIAIAEQLQKKSHIIEFLVRLILVWVHENKRIYVHYINTAFYLLVFKLLHSILHFMSKVNVCTVYAP